MLPATNRDSGRFPAASPARLNGAAPRVACAALTLALGVTAWAQQPVQQNPAPPPAEPAQQNPAPQPTPQDTAGPQDSAAPQAPAAQQPAATVPTPTEIAPAPADQPQPSAPSGAQQPITPAPVQGTSSATREAGGITEEEMKQLLVGKPLYLRGGYLDDSLTFNEHGVLIGHSPLGSYALCAVQIDKVRLTRHKVELQGARYGLHFLGALPYEDPSAALDRVRITPKKKMLKITIDREIVVKPKKEKQKEAAAKTLATTKPAASAPAPNAPASNAPTPSQAEAAPDADSNQTEIKAEIAAAPPEERPSDPASVTTTTSPAHAAKVLKQALDAIFSQGLDGRMLASMPDFWRLYYEAAAAKTDYRPKDPAVLRQSAVDTKAKLLTTFEPASNEFAQANGVAGMALYHAVIGPDGKPGEIAVARPIGFGLDENAVAAIRDAKFEPAMKNGQPVPVLLDLVVQFRIYSKRTAETGKTEEAAKPAEPSLPGPYSVQHAQPTQP
jgi:TonB family protein